MAAPAVPIVPPADGGYNYKRVKLEQSRADRLCSPVAFTGGELRAFGHRCGCTPFHVRASAVKPPRTRMSLLPKAKTAPTNPGRTAAPVGGAPALVVDGVALPPHHIPIVRPPVLHHLDDYREGVSEGVRAERVLRESSAPRPARLVQLRSSATFTTSSRAFVNGWGLRAAHCIPPLPPSELQRGGADDVSVGPHSPDDAWPAHFADAGGDCDWCGAAESGRWAGSVGAVPLVNSC